MSRNPGRCSSRLFRLGSCRSMNRSWKFSARVSSLARQERELGDESVLLVGGAVRVLVGRVGAAVSGAVVVPLDSVVSTWVASSSAVMFRKGKSRK